MHWFLFMYFLMDWIALCIILIKDIYIMILPFSLQDMTM